VIKKIKSLEKVSLAIKPVARCSAPVLGPIFAQGQAGWRRTGDNRMLVGAHATVGGVENRAQFVNQCLVAVAHPDVRDIGAPDVVAQHTLLFEVGSSQPVVFHLGV